MKKVEKEFQQINSLIERHWARAIGLANAESLMTYWAIGAYVSAKLKTAEWGSKVIEELCDFALQSNARQNRRARAIASKSPDNDIYEQSFWGLSPKNPRLTSTGIRSTSAHSGAATGGRA